MCTSPRLHVATNWNLRIDRAVAEPNPACSNAKITDLHAVLGRELSRVVGGGPNFHTWAVWGSGKAGETIRGEGNEGAEQEVPLVAALAGLLAGLAYEWGFALTFAAAGWVVARFLIHLGTRRAAGLVLAGNRLVLADIGRVTARYLALFRFDRQLSLRKLADFLLTLPDDQKLLRRAFACYHRARFADGSERERLMWEGNCLAVLHEHQMLQPYISGAIPLGLRRYVTARLLKYRVGELNLRVSAPLPASRFASSEPAVAEHLATSPVKATDWADLHDRMRYVFALFAAYHAHPAVASDTTARRGYNPSHSTLWN